MKLNDRILHGGAWEGASIASQAILQFVVLAVLARNLEAEAFGTVALANIFMAFALLFSEIGVGPAIVQKKNLCKEHISTGFAITLLLGIIFTALTWLLSPTIANYFDNDQLIPILHLLSLTFIIRSTGIISASLLQREFQFKKLMVINFTSSTIGYATVGIVLALHGYGVFSLVLAMLGQELIRAVLLTSLRPHTFLPTISSKHIYELVNFGAGLTLARLFNYFALQGDRFIIAKFLGTTTLGYYHIAFQIMLLPSRYIGDVFDKVLFTALSSIQDEKDRVSNIFNHTSSIANLLVLPLSVILIANAEKLVLVVVGADWLQIVSPLQIMLLGAGFRVNTRLSDALMRATGAVYYNAVVKLIYAIAIICSCFIGKEYQMVGIAWAVLLAVIIHYSLVLFYCFKYVNTSFSKYLKSIAPGLFYAILSYLVSKSSIEMLGHFELSAYISLLLSILVTISAIMITALLFPKSLGNSGIWLYRTMHNRLTQSS